MPSYLAIADAHSSAWLVVLEFHNRIFAVALFDSEFSGLEPLFASLGLGLLLVVCENIGLT